MFGEGGYRASDIYLATTPVGSYLSGSGTLYFTGLTYMEEGQNGPAEDAFKKTAGSWSSDLAALGKFSLAQLYEQTGRDPQAVDLFNELSNGKASTVPPGLAQIQLASDDHHRLQSIGQPAALLPA